MTTQIPVSAEKVVATAGTAVPLFATKTLAISFSIVAKAGNTGNIFVGGASVDNTINDGFPASKGYSWAAHGTWPYIDLAGIFIDAAQSGEGVEIYYTPASPNA